MVLASMSYLDELRPLHAALFLALVLEVVFVTVHL